MRVGSVHAYICDEHPAREMDTSPLFHVRLHTKPIRGPIDARGDRRVHKCKMLHAA